MKPPKSVLTIATLSVMLGLLFCSIGIWAMTLGDFRFSVIFLTSGSVTGFSAVEIAQGKTRGYNDLSVGLLLSIVLTLLITLFGFVIGDQISHEGMVYTSTSGLLCLLSTVMLGVLRSSSVSRWVVERQLDEI